MIMEGQAEVDITFDWSVVSRKTARVLLLALGTGFISISES